MSGTTTRLHLPFPGLADGPDGADVPYWIQQLAEALDGAAIDDQGILANRPAFGVKGRYYFVKGDGTPANNGILWRDNGTGWDAIGTVSPNSVGTTELKDNAVTNAKMADNSVGAAEIIDGTVGTAELAPGAVTGPKVDNTLKPSAGASAGTEALRALGTGAGTAAAGNDGRLSDTRVPTDNTVGTAKIQNGAVTPAKMSIKVDGGVTGALDIGYGAGAGEFAVSFATAFAATPGIGVVYDNTGAHHYEGGDDSVDIFPASDSPQLALVASSSTGFTVRVSGVNGGVHLSGFRIRWVAIGP